MFRSTVKLVLLSLLLVGGSAGLYLYHEHNSLDAKLQEEREKNDQLRLIVQRLSAERRVADVVVSDQSTIAGVVHTTLAFEEYDRTGAALPIKRFVIEGAMAHIDAMVVKFEGRFVQENDPLRGHSIALFTRLYGDKQSPQSAQAIDEPGQIPAIYRSSDSRVSQFEQELWRNFWKLADDSAYREQMGVRVAQGEGVWRPFERGYVYKLTLENNGGLNITSEKLPAIYREIGERHADGG